MRHARHTTHAAPRRRGARALLIGALSVTLLTTGTSSLASVTDDAELDGTAVETPATAPAEPGAPADAPVETVAPDEAPATAPTPTAPAAPVSPAPVSPAPAAPVNPAPAAPVSPEPVAPASPGPATPQRAAVSPLSAPTATANSAVINVNVGATRTSLTTVSPLAGATLELWNGSSSPTTKVDAAWATCVSDAEGDCSFTVPRTGQEDVVTEVCGWVIWPVWRDCWNETSTQDQENRDRQFWIVQEVDPAGYFLNKTLRTSGGSTAYRFRTSGTLRPGQVDEYPVTSTGNGSTVSGGVWQSSMANPALPPQCGLDVALVLDLSGSVNDNGLEAMKTASRGFVDALTGTPSSVALFTFATTAPKSGGTSGASYPNLVPVTTASSASTVKSRIAAYSATGGTNWDAGLYQVAAAEPHYDVAVVLTDGDPTFSVASNGVDQDGPGSATYLREIERGIFSANAIKDEGTRVIAVGVGTGVSGDAANLRAISGTVQGSDYYQSANYAAAGAALRELALASCRGTVSVVKEVVPEGAPAGSIQGSAPAAGWEFSASAPHPVAPAAGTTGSDGAVSFTVTLPGGTTTAPVTVRETARSGYTLQPVSGKNAVCKNLATGANVTVTNDGALGFRVTASSTAPITCTVYNRETPPRYADLGVSVSATTAFDRVYDWSIAKTVRGSDRAEVPAGTDATFTYDVVVTPSAPKDSAFTVAGEVVVTNPNDIALTGVDVAAGLPGVTCTVMNGTGRTIPARADLYFFYTCALPGGSSTATGTVTATATWTGASYLGTDGSTQASTGYAFADGDVITRSTTVIVDDSHVDLADYADGQRAGNIVRAADGPATFTYDLSWPSVGGTCETYDNTASISPRIIARIASGTGVHASSTETVTVCGGMPLTVDKTVDVAHTRTYGWTIEKNADASTLDVDATGHATLGYTVDVAPTGEHADSGWAMSGTIAVTNPNDWQAVTADVTDAPGIGGGGVCTVDGGSDVVVPKGATVELGYDCTFASQPHYTGTNAATATWDAAEHATAHGVAGVLVPIAEADWGVTEADTSVTVMDDRTDPANPVELGTVALADAPRQFRYDLTHAGVRGRCDVTYGNRAWLAETGQEDSTSVTVCWQTPGIDVVKRAWEVTSGPVPAGAAELPYGAELLGGTTITWTYAVTNTGTSQLDDIEVTDTFTTDSGTGEVSLTCPSTSLAAGASMTCTGSGPVGAGTYGLSADQP